MGIFVESKKIRKIEDLKRKIDKKRLGDFVTLMNRNMMEQVASQAAILDEDNALRRRDVVKSFTSAWEYAQNIYTGSISIPLLQDIAGRIEPGMRNEGMIHAPIRNFGGTKLEIDGEVHVPPSDRERIYVHLNRMFEAAEIAHFHPIEEAAFYGMHIVRIQPFDNGNKRLSLIVMNSILNANGFAPVSFPLSRQREYKQVLGRGILGFKHMASLEDELIPYLRAESRQSNYFNHIADREIEELSLCESRLEGLDHYKIHLKRKTDPGVAYSMKRKISSWFISSGKPFQVRIDPKSLRLEVYGSIEEETLRELLNKSNGDIKYSIN
jgi:prophage maintenance system killer protein